MRLELSFQTEITDDQDPEQKVNDVAAVLEEQGLTVVGWHQSTNDTPYTVVGVVKGKPKERWSEVVMAQGEEEAEMKAAALAPKGQERTVAASLPSETGVTVSEAADPNTTKKES